ncbi:MAG: nucleotidyl transferase AbiEii/AbiGii toxin family protein [Deferribacteres bacterium]|nr:nucleotidyl transferase AbiEii/AbiGii toxin family protein [Deferribacteres bacterium]
MNPQFNAIWEAHRFFKKEGIPYVLIGGIALQWWGEPRFTRDVDVTILVEPGEEEKVIRKILNKFSPRISDALEFAIKNRVCLVKSKSGYEIDISLGIPGYEEEVIRRTVECELDRNRTVNICSAEDLIIHKAVAGRPQDLSDIEGIILRQGRKLDVEYIHLWLREFSDILETGEIIERFEKPWRKLRTK